MKQVVCEEREQISKDMMTGILIAEVNLIAIRDMQISVDDIGSQINWAMLFLLSLEYARTLLNIIINIIIP